MNPRTLLFSLLLSTVLGPAQECADVVVYGGTPGGFCAAIAATREGVSVILLEPTEHVGGLSHCDSNQMARETLMGLFDEWRRRIVKDYTARGLPAPYDAAFKDNAKWTFEPHVAMGVTLAMLKENGVTVKTGRYWKSITKDGPRITSLVTKDGTFSAKVFVDGTYEGDLIAAAGVDWTMGREGRAEFGESYAGKQYPKKKMDIITSPEKDDAIAISSFPIHSHDCQRVALKTAASSIRHDFSRAGPPVQKSATPTMCANARCCRRTTNAAICSCPSRSPAHTSPCRRCASKALGGSSARAR